MLSWRMDSAPSSNVGRPGLRAQGRGDVLYQSMARMITEGEFAEGSRLPSEAELAVRFSVSRPMVREVLSRLRENGAIRSRKGSGSFVQRNEKTHAAEPRSIGFAPTSSLAQVKKGYEFRIGLEGEAAFWAAQNHRPQTLAQIRTALDELEDAIQLGALGVDADYAFHVAIASASDNEFFEAVMISMREQMTFAMNLSRSLSLTRPIERLRAVQAEHVTIFEAITDRNKEAASSAMRAHISNTCDRVFEGSVDKYGGPLPL